jgi:hypothetical protein
MGTSKEKSSVGMPPKNLALLPRRRVFSRRGTSITEIPPLTTFIEAASKSEISETNARRIRKKVECVTATQRPLSDFDTSAVKYPMDATALSSTFLYPKSRQQQILEIH